MNMNTYFTKKKGMQPHAQLSGMRYGEVYLLEKTKKKLQATVSRLHTEARATSNLTLWYPT